MSLTLLMRTRAQFSATKKSLRLAVVHSLAPGLGWSSVRTDKRFRHSVDELRSTEAFWEDRAPRAVRIEKNGAGELTSDEQVWSPLARLCGS